MNLREFGSWALNQRSVANPSPNFKYKGQCVSLIQQYLYQVFGMPFQAHGNAKDWANNVPANFTKLPASTKLQRGDILVYGGNYGGGYGHIGLIDANWKYYDQNGIKSLAVSYRDKPF
ncbi:MAG: CHAP domain-containing protein, partial [Clostridia bacterium]